MEEGFLWQRGLLRDHVLELIVLVVVQVEVEVVVDLVVVVFVGSGVARM